MTTTECPSNNHNHHPWVPTVLEAVPSHSPVVTTGAQTARRTCPPSHSRIEPGPRVSRPLCNILSSPESSAKRMCSGSVSEVQRAPPGCTAAGAGGTGSSSLLTGAGDRQPVWLQPQGFLFLTPPVGGATSLPRCLLE